MFEVFKKTVQGLYVVTDIYPFHLQARKVGELISHIRSLFMWFNLAQLLDNGLPYITIHIALRIWIPCCSIQVG